MRSNTIILRWFYLMALSISYYILLDFTKKPNKHLEAKQPVMIQGTKF